MNNLYKHKSGLTVDVIAIANTTATDGRPILMVYQVLKSGEVFTETAMQFTEDYTPISDVEADTQLQGIDFIA